MGSQYESQKVGNILAQKELSGLHLVQFECPRHWKPLVSSKIEVGGFPFSHYHTEIQILLWREGGHFLYGGQDLF